MHIENKKSESNFDPFDTHVLLHGSGKVLIITERFRGVEDNALHY